MHGQAATSMKWSSGTPIRAGPTIDGTAEIKEIHVAGDIAYMWSHLTVVMAVPDGSPPVRREGHMLTILRKIRGRWLLARDANLFVKA